MYVNVIRGKLQVQGVFSGNLQPSNVTSKIVPLGQV